MTTARLKQQFPHRFLSEEDALAFQASRFTRSDLIVPVFEEVDGKTKVRQQWKDAPFELNMIAFLEQGEKPPVNFELYQYKL